MSSSVLSATGRSWIRSAIVKASQIRTISSQPPQQLLSTLTCRRPINTHWRLSTVTANGRSRAAPPLCLWIFQEQQQQRGFATKGEDSAESDDEEEEFRDENGMTMKEREKIEKWAENFTKDSIPKGLLTLNFVRSSGPGGQNVNKGKWDGLEQCILA